MKGADLIRHARHPHSRWTSLRRSLVAALVIVALVTACGGDDDGASETTAATSSTATTEPLTATAPPDPATVELVLASDEGVHRVDGDGESTLVSDAPAASAFGVAEFVVFQHSGAGSGIYPARLEGPVLAWSGDQARVLPIGPDATSVTLLDARHHEGEPVALVAERLGDTRPESTFEELVVINLAAHTRTTLVRRPAWESAHRAGHLLSNGDLIGLISSEAHTTLNRWSANAEEPRWTAEVGIDVTADLAAVVRQVTVVEAFFDEERDFAPVLALTTYDPETGVPGPTQTIDIADPDSDIGTGLFCGEWLDPSELACARGGGPPIAVSLDDGSVTHLPGEPGATPTVVRAG